VTFGEAGALPALDVCGGGLLDIVVIEDTWDDGSDRSVLRMWDPVMPVEPRTRIDAMAGSLCRGKTEIDATGLLVPERGCFNQPARLVSGKHGLSLDHRVHRQETLVRRDTGAVVDQRCYSATVMVRSR